PRPGRGQGVVLAGATGASWRWRADASEDEATIRQTAERRVDGSRGHDATGAFLDMRADGAAVRLVAQRGHREENQLFEFAEMPHVVCSDLGFNHYVVKYVNRRDSGRHEPAHRTPRRSP